MVYFQRTAGALRLLFWCEHEVLHENLAVAAKEIG
jgi:hypothetical protein